MSAGTLSASETASTTETTRQTTTETAPRIASGPQRATFCFSVRAVAEAGIMPRVMELFAKRDLVPNRWYADLIEGARDELSIDLQVADIDPELADYIARCMRQIWGVETVLTSEKRFA